MHRKTAVPFIIAMILFVSLACGMVNPGNTAQQPSQQPSQQLPAPAATQAEATNLPAATSTQASSKYFQEDFNGGLANWSHFVVNGKNYQVMQSDPGDMKLGIQDGFLVFDLQGPREWVYSIYNARRMMMCALMSV